MFLQGKVAIVTGSGGAGCGRAIAVRLARDGCAVMISDIDERGAARTLELIESEGNLAAMQVADVTSEEAMRALTQSTVDRFGGLDILVNTASAPFRPGDPLAHWFESLNVDLLGTMYAIRSAIPAMRRRGGGAIVNIGSTSAVGHGLNASASAAYDVPKAAVLRLTTSLGALGASDRIRINCLVPDWVATPAVKAYWDALPDSEKIPPRIPKVLTTVEEIAYAVTCLITDETLAGRVLVWWSGTGPSLIAKDDPGYAALEPYSRAAHA